MNFYHAFIRTCKSVFALPSPLLLAARELNEAELELLKADSNVEFSESIALYNRNRIRRLKAFIVVQTKE